MSPTLAVADMPAVRLLLPPWKRASLEMLPAVSKRLALADGRSVVLARLEESSSLLFGRSEKGEN